MHILNCFHDDMHNNYYVRGSGFFNALYLDLCIRAANCSE